VELVHFPSWDKTAKLYRGQNKPIHGHQVRIGPAGSEEWNGQQPITIIKRLRGATGAGSTEGIVGRQK